jgi:UDP-N-acetylglucosamine diphosphorylase / glucose-1-phosphate thymidylyltransferase / UDP-N-acetylgalactosamine diphosphorylase / glucosamine-1-phosphate N-acetyltransferase / galactosamine-1-phosphate N-acetyltransferase
MKAVILCAGQSTRTYPLTVHKPKQILPVMNVSVLKHTVQQLQGLVSGIYVVVGQHEAAMKNALKEFRNIVYVQQAKPRGTGDAVMHLQNHVKEKFFVLNGDDLYNRDDLKKMTSFDTAILVKSVQQPEHYGVVEKKGLYLQAIREKPRKAKTNLVNTGAYLVDKDIFQYNAALKKTKRNEVEFTDMIQAYAKDHKVRVVTASFWIPITFPWSILEAHESMMASLQSDIKGVIERFVTIKGDVVIGKNSVVKSGTYIEGPVIIGTNCSIGPNAYLRASTVIGNNCKIGNAVEIKNSTVMDGTNIGHLSYIGDSVIGEDVNMGAGTITANLRHDGKTIETPVKGVMHDTGRRKLGVIAGDSVHTGISTSFYPGRKLWPGTSTLPGEIVKKDIMKKAG